MGAYGAAGMPMVGQPSGVPGWALFLLGLLGGFLITLALFKYTALAEGLRPDLIEYGRSLIKDENAEALKRGEEAEPAAPEPSAEEPAPEVERDASGQPAPDGGTAAEEEGGEGEEPMPED